MREELRCFCSSNTLLAVIGYEDGQAYLHLKSHRKNRILLEAKIDGGRVRLRCRSCDRWHSLAVRQSVGRSIDDAGPNVRQPERDYRSL